METRTKLDWMTYQNYRGFWSSHPCWMHSAEWDCINQTRLTTLDIIRNYWRGVLYNTGDPCGWSGDCPNCSGGSHEGKSYGAGQRNRTPNK